MARTSNIQNILDSLLQSLGTQVAQGVADGLQKSGLFKQLEKVKSSPSSGRPGRKPGKKKTCSAKGCNLPARAKGLCTKHYQQARYAEKHGADKPAKAGKRGRPPKAAKNVVVKKKAPKRIAPKKKAPKKVAPKKAKLALVPETPAPAPETKE